MSVNQSDEITVSRPSDLEIRFTRTFNWPASLLFEAWTKAEHIRHWWGCEGSIVLMCEMDVRVGGEWHLVGTMPGGGNHSFGGRYTEVVTNERLVYTECYENPELGNPQWLTTVEFEKTKNGTRLTHTMLHPSRLACEQHLKAGMEVGEADSLRRLDNYLALIGG